MLDNRLRFARNALLVVIGPFLVASAADAEDDAENRPRVEVLRVPEGGIQPQAVVGPEGTIHLLFFKGEPAAGDLFYARRAVGATEFSSALRVNSQPKSAIAMGTIRGGQIAVGQGGRIHVAWNGSGEARPKPPGGGVPMLYTRLDDSGTAFEPQRNLMVRTTTLDGGGSIAADSRGTVYVAWHARTNDSEDGEMGRRLWFARSTDEGATFAPEEPALEQQTGACACCGTRAIADRSGHVYVLYRAATHGTERDMFVATSGDQGRHWRGLSLQPWRTNSCPMSSASLFDTASGVLAAWETQGQVAFSRVEVGMEGPPERLSPPGGRGDRKHPAVAGNARGETILTWAEGTGWQRGGALAWQVFDPEGRPTETRGRVKNGIPTWSLPTVVTAPDGHFVLIH